MKVLRDYQLTAINGDGRWPGILPALTAHPSTLLVMATGLGKSVVIAKVANGWTRGNVLILAHRIELLDQMADHLSHELGYRPSVEQGPRGLDPETLFAAGHVLVGSVQSMITERRLRKFQKHSFGLVIVDEAHRATAGSYVKLIDRYRELDPEMKLLGVTATPNRTDGTALGLVFNSVAFQMDICDGIDQGWLVDIHQKFAVCEDLDLSKIPLTKNEFGEKDFQTQALEELLSQEGPLHSMSRPVLDCTQNGEQAIVFTASVRHAHLWAAVLNSYRPGCAAAVDGSMAKGINSERDELVRRYKHGELQFLLNFNIFTEGFDAPSTSFVVFGRPTKSELVKKQMLGRATRPIPGIVDGLATPEERKDAIAASAKPFAVALDFVRALPTDIVTASDVLGGNFDVDVRRAADEIIGPRGAANVRDGIAKARASLLLEAEEKRRAPLRKFVQGARIHYYLGDIDGGTRTGGGAPITSRGGATDAQVAALVNLGVDRDKALSYGRKQAGVVLTKLRGERCTLKQAATLRKYGYDPDDFNVATASKKIDAIKEAGWQRV